jgi:hypothetical protein
MKSALVVEAGEHRPVRRVERLVWQGREQLGPPGRRALQRPVARN